MGSDYEKDLTAANLEERIVELDNLRLKMVRAGLLRQGRRLHRATQTANVAVCLRYAEWLRWWSQRAKITCAFLWPELGRILRM